MLLNAALGEIIVAAHNPIQAALLIARALEPRSRFLYATTEMHWRSVGKFMAIATKLAENIAGTSAFVGHCLAPSHFDLLARDEDDPWSIACTLDSEYSRQFLGCQMMQKYATQKWKGPLLDSHYIEWLVRQFRQFDQLADDVVKGNLDLTKRRESFELSEMLHVEKRVRKLSSAIIAPAEGLSEDDDGTIGTAHGGASAIWLDSYKLLQGRSDANTVVCTALSMAKGWKTLRGNSFGGTICLRILRWATSLSRTLCAPIYAPFLAWQLPVVHYWFDAAVRILMIINHAYICSLGPYIEFGVSHYILVLLALGFLMAEVEQWDKTSASVYFHDVSNIIDLTHSSIFFCAGMVFGYTNFVLGREHSSYETGANVYYIMMISAFVILLARFLWIFELHPDYGPFVGVLASMFQSLVKFLVILFIISITFSFAFYALFHIAAEARVAEFGDFDAGASWDVENYKTLYKSMQQTIRIFFGEVSFEDFDDMPAPWNHIGETMLLLYIIIGTLLLGNLFIAVVSEEYQPDEMSIKYRASVARVVNEYAERIRFDRLPPPLNIVGGLLKFGSFILISSGKLARRAGCSGCHCYLLRRWRHAPGTPDEATDELFSFSRSKLSRCDHQFYLAFRLAASTLCCPFFPTLGICFSCRRRVCKTLIRKIAPTQNVGETADEGAAYTREVKTLCWNANTLEVKPGRCRSWRIDFNRAFCWNDDDISDLRLAVHKFFVKYPDESRATVVERSVRTWLEQNSDTTAMRNDDSTRSLLQACLLDEMEMEFDDVLPSSVHMNSAYDIGRDARQILWRLCGGRLSLTSLLDPYLTYISWKRLKALKKNVNSREWIENVLSMPATSFAFSDALRNARGELARFDTARVMLEHDFHNVR